MRSVTSLCFGAVVFLVLSANAATYSIPVEKVNTQKVYFGSATGFEKAGKVDYETVVRATPEFEEVKKNKIERNTGKYWILLSQASERAVRAISEVGEQTGFDFIAAQAYLGSLDPAIPSEDITPLVLNLVKDEVKPKEDAESKGSTKLKSTKEKTKNTQKKPHDAAEKTSAKPK